MLGLPSSTELNRRIAKDKLYANAGVTPVVRELIKDQIEAVIWRNKLGADTMAVTTGEVVSELQVFEVQLRQQSLDKRVLTTVAKAIPYKIVFVLTYEDMAQAWLDVEGVFYHTDWQAVDQLILTFEGTGLDTMYDRLARQIAGGRLGEQGSIVEAVEQDQRRQDLEREISTLEKKLAREKQLNKQVEINQQLKALKKEKGVNI